MNFEIKKNDWAGFFESLSKRRYEWKIKVEVLNPDMGDQTLTDGLPLNGVTVETRGDHTSLDISVGGNTDVHQTHNIKNPTSVTLLSETDSTGDVIDIEEDDGTKTLISFIEPISVIVGFSGVNLIVTAA